MSPQETGAFIAKLRKESGITQQELAERLNVTAKAFPGGKQAKVIPMLLFCLKFQTSLTCLSMNY